MTHCDGFSRAQAGRGLPTIEPGMPDPAGTGMTRRSLLLRGAGLALTVYGASRTPLPALQAGVAQAATPAGDRVLVSIFLPGGLDGLTALAPVGDPRYAALRSTLRLPDGAGTAFDGDDRLRWAPQLGGVARLHAEGKVAVAPAIGYHDADQSHFTSRHYWEVGDTDARADRGWLGRYLDRHGDPTNPLQGLSLGTALSPVLAGSDAPVSAVDRPGDLGLWDWRAGTGQANVELRTAIDRLSALPTQDPALRRARGTAAHVDAIERALRPFADPAQGPVAYPSGDFGLRLRGLAAMVAGGLPLRAVTVDGPGGYDTHDDQPPVLDRNLRALDEGLVAFQRDLETRGVADRVLTVVWSEFGRRPQQNATGTDHGAAGLALVVGSRVRGGLLGEHPGLGRLDEDGNLRTTTDFRSVYRGVLEQWFGVDARDVLPSTGAFAAATLLR